MLGSVIGDSLKGKTVFRSLFEAMLRTIAVPGAESIVDLGGVKHPFPGYASALGATEERITAVNLSHSVGADIVGDIKQTGLPDDMADETWAMNVLEHVPAIEPVLQESFRITKKGSRMIAVIPFLIGVHGEPNDYARYTASKLHMLFTQAGFSDIDIRVVGHGPFVAGFSLMQPVLPRFVSAISVSVFWMLDTLLFGLRPSWRGRWPLGYCVIARKPFSRV